MVDLWLIQWLLSGYVMGSLMVRQPLMATIWVTATPLLAPLPRIEGPERDSPGAELLPPNQQPNG